MQAGMPLQLTRTLLRPRPRASFGWRPKGLLACLLLLVAWSLSPLRLGFVSGSSMAPTYRSGQPFLMTRTNAMHPSVGSVVVFDHDGQPYIKRVLAIEGQEIWGVAWSESGGHPDMVLPRGRVARMDRIMKKHPQLGRVIHFTVPKDHVFVVGDGISSQDSRRFGPVPVEAIRGIVVAPVRARESAPYLRLAARPS